VAGTEPAHVTRSEPAVATSTAEKRERVTNARAAVVRQVAARAMNPQPSLRITRSEPARDAALLERAEDGDLAGVRRLVAEGASQDARAAAGLAPLMLAVIHDQTAIIDLLIARNAGVNAQNGLGLTPLMFAAINNRASALQTLMARGANPNVRTRAGWTALTYAAWRGHPEIVRVLLARGADARVIDRAGWTALEYATWRAGQ